MLVTRPLHGDSTRRAARREFHRGVLDQPCREAVITNGLRRRRGVGSVTAEAALARAQPASAALALVGTTAHSATHLARERVARGEDVLGWRERRAGRSRRRTISASTAAGGARRTIFRAVHAQTAPTEIVAVELANRVGCFRIGCELGEGETTGAAGLAVCSDVNAGNLSRLRQQCRELVLSSIEAQIADEDFVRNDRLLLVCRW